jgi:hypothetical protein
MNALSDRLTKRRQRVFWNTGNDPAPMSDKYYVPLRAVLICSIQLWAGAQAHRKQEYDPIK